MTQGIYGITHTASKRVYVGASNDIDLRFKAHMSLLQRGAHHAKELQKIFDLEGADNLSFAVLEEVADKKNIHDREGFWINQTGAAVSGFNQTNLSNYATFAVASDPFREVRAALLLALQREGITQAELARRLDVPRQNVNRAIRGETPQGRVPPLWARMLQEAGLKLVAIKEDSDG